MELHYHMMWFTSHIRIIIPPNKKNKNALRSITTFTLVAIFLFLLKGWTHRHLSALGGVSIWILVCFFRSLKMTKGGRMKITTKCKKYQDSVCTCKPANRCCRLLSCSSLLCCNWGWWGEGCWTWSWNFQTFVSSAFASTLQSDKA